LRGTTIHTVFVAVVAWVENSAALARDSAKGATVLISTLRKEMAEGKSKVRTKRVAECQHMIKARIKKRVTHRTRCDCAQLRVFVPVRRLTNVYGMRTTVDLLTFRRPRCVRAALQHNGADDEFGTGT
jgi:hypothetical protein